MGTIAKSAIFGAAIVSGYEHQPDGKCRALALRGGGTKGAYEVGALKVMVEMLPKIDTDYDVVVGVSIGGMNAGLIALFEVGDE